MRHRILQAGLCAILAITCAGTAFAQATTSFAVFATVDAIRELAPGNELLITGIPRDQQSSATIRVTGNSSNADGLAACRQMALLMMDKPGKFLLEVNVSSGSSSAYCRLSRNPAATTP